MSQIQQFKDFAIHVDLIPFCLNTLKQIPGITISQIMHNYSLLLSDTVEHIFFIRNVFL